MPEIIRVNGKDYSVSEIKAEMKRLQQENEEIKKFAEQRDKDAKMFGKAWQELSDKVKELEKSVDIYKTVANNLLGKEII